MPSVSISYRAISFCHKHRTYYKPSMVGSKKRKKKTQSSTEWKQTAINQQKTVQAANKTCCRTGFYNAIVWRPSYGTTNRNGKDESISQCLVVLFSTNCSFYKQQGFITKPKGNGRTYYIHRLSELMYI